ncbi:MAG: hypothetical protein J3Q66DRAFT_359501 [Benniella sp.]|nr:MAG: hypothetical protein J3Q66DRAFT_359501 [Benniella sp.]
MYPSIWSSENGVMTASWNWVVCLLTLIVAIADQDELAMHLEFSDLWLCKFHLPFIDGWQVDMKWYVTILLVSAP